MFRSIFTAAVVCVPILSIASGCVVRTRAPRDVYVEGPRGEHHEERREEHREERHDEHREERH